MKVSIDEYCEPSHKNSSFGLDCVNECKFEGNAHVTLSRY